MVGILFRIDQSCDGHWTRRDEAAIVYRSSHIQDGHEPTMTCFLIFLAFKTRVYIHNPSMGSCTRGIL
jgi:hypothetical protein